MWRAMVALGALGTVISGTVGCRLAAGEEIPDLGPPAPPATVATSRAVLNPRLLRRFRPLGVRSPGDAAQIALGKLLFFDPRLSRNHDVACNTCHPLDHAGVDHRATSLGSDGRAGTRNAPTVFNAALQVAQFWDGRAADLEQQVALPLLAPDEMAMLDAASVAEALRRIPGYASAFATAFPGEREPRDLPHVARAIAAFERTLTTPSRWDRYLAGDDRALTPAEVAGFRRFSDLGCVDCHTGELIGGSMFQKVGVVEPWPNQRDQGCYEVTLADRDRMVFKVPSLRNVARTAPYFHDGSVADLQTAIAQMARYQLGIEVSGAEVASIETWLEALDGETMRVAPPTLP